MANLNPQQADAVRHRTGPMLILAGAGTGKTSVVTERIAGMIRDGIQPKNILGVTFTNKAAAEMRSRLARMIGSRVAGGVTLSTFHSLCVRIIRRDAGLLGYSPGFSICDQGEQIALARKAAATVHCPDLPGLDAVVQRIGFMKNRGISSERCQREAVEDAENAVAAIYRRYQQALRRQNSLDFDDLLLRALELFDAHPDALEYWRDRFRYVMVDEFQDTNKIQFELVRRLASPRDNLAVVGDDDQSIYSWRGAVAGNILKFHEVYPAAKLVTLEQNYRSTTAILSTANGLIQNNPGRREKNLWSRVGAGKPVLLKVHNDQFDEASAVASAICAKRDGAEGQRFHYADFAVIVRSNAQTKVFEDEFMASHIPFEVIGGQSVYDHKESRDVLSFLAVTANPDADNQVLRIINVPPRGIGGKTVDLLSEQARKRGVSLFRQLSEAEGMDGLQKAQKEACGRFVGLVEGWRKRLLADGVNGLTQAILEEAGYQEELQELYENPLEAASRWNQAVAVGDGLAAHAERNADEHGGDPQQALAAFLQDAMLAAKADGDERRAGRDEVKIITGHSAKGLEYPYVFIPSLEEDLFPHKRAVEEGNVEEERRLLYVAMTRARLELTLSYCRSRESRGKSREVKPSRFLDELPPELLQRDESPTRAEETAEWLAGLRERLKKGKS